MKIGTVLALVVAALLASAAPLGASEPQAGEKVDIITPHITNGDHMEIPWILPPFFKEVTLPHWEPVHVGPLTLDLSPSKHVVFLLLGATLLVLVMTLVARAHKRAAASGVAPKGAANAFEAIILFIRNEVILPNVGHHGEGFVPYLLTAFFFILTLNLLGQIPIFATATGNINVTMALAAITLGFMVIGTIVKNGPVGFVKCFVPHGVPWPVLILLIPIEFAGMFIKAAALMIRLFANMMAGHIVVLALLSLCVAIKLWVAVLAVPLGIAIGLLEVFVCFLQAYIFTLLSAMFIGQMYHPAH